jgi:hypothetical protein
MAAVTYNRRSKWRQDQTKNLSAGVQKENCCGYKRRMRFCGTEWERNSVSGSGLGGPGRACWRGRGESVTRCDRRQRELELVSPLPPLARPRQQTARLPRFLPRKPMDLGPSYTPRKRRKTDSPFELPPFSFCTRPDRPNEESDARRKEDAIGRLWKGALPEWSMPFRVG